jgi:folate-binding protein YgfZ
MNATLFDLSSHGKVQVSGPDAAKFLHNLSTNEIVNLPAGSGCEAFLTTGQAKIIAYVFIFRVQLPDGGQEFWLDTGPGMGEKVHSHLDRYLVSEQVELADSTPDARQFHLAGHDSVELLGKLVGPDVSLLAKLQHLIQPVPGGTCQIRRVPRLSSPGLDILCPTGQGDSLAANLLAAGARRGTEEEFEIGRLEAGTPVYGKDIDETNLPQEVGRVLETISFTKGCYIGQETVARIRTYGHVNRMLVGMTLSANMAPAPGTQLLREGKEVGKITSSAVSDRIGSGIALGYVRRGNELPGTMLQIDGASATALVTALPFGAGSGGAAGV